MKIISLSLTGLFIFVGCKSATIGPVSGENMEVPMQQKQSCSKLCKNLEMTLGAMVIMSNRTGCVCEVLRGKGRKNASAAVSAGATVALIEAEKEQRKKEEARRSEEERQRRQRQQELQRQNTELSI